MTNRQRLWLIGCAAIALVELPGRLSAALGAETAATPGAGLDGTLDSILQALTGQPVYGLGIAVGVVCILAGALMPP
jgi:hypothetical protein